MIQVRNWGTGRRAKFIYADFNGVVRSWSDTEGVRIDIHIRESEPAFDEAKFMTVRMDRKSAAELVTRLNTVLAQGVDP